MVSNNDRKVVLFPTPADTTIEEVFDRFLTEQRTRLKDRTFANYRNIIGLLRNYLNGYAYSCLSESEGDLFDRYFNADDETHREFCQLFGPEKIPENLGGFLGDFMVRKVIAGSDFKRAGGTVTRSSPAGSSKGDMSVLRTDFSAHRRGYSHRTTCPARRRQRIFLLRSTTRP